MVEDDGRPEAGGHGGGVAALSPPAPVTLDPGHRIASLDGLRGVAVLAVCLFHFGVPHVPGGFLGVDVFYVLSGYLITSLLVREFGRTATVRLGHFWARRARRLLPALGLMLAAVTLFVRYVALPGTYPGYRGDALATLLYVSNWHQIATSTNYFVATGPVSPLTHTWSLAVEEQFYLVWPPVVLAVLHLVRPAQRAVAVLLTLAVAGTVASQAWMALGMARGWSTTRLYFGTDTHAMSVLAGAALALAVVARPRLRVTWPVGVAALAGLVVAMVTVTGAEGLLYRAGFLVVAVLTVLLLAALTTGGRSPLAAALSLRPLAWLGLISYGVYLWHFPVWIALTPARTGLSGWPLVGLQLATSVAVAAASYYLVERPVLRGTFWRSLRALPLAAAGTVGVGALVVATTVAPATGAAAPPVRYHPVAAAPPEVVVLGDSTALALGVALQATAPAGVHVDDAALWGCGLSISVSAGLARVPTCNQATPAAGQWPALDTKAVAATGPGDQVVFLAGHWETGDTTFADGRTLNLSQPAFQRYEAAQLETLYRVATAHGAHLDLLTMAAMDGNFPYGTAPAATDTPPRRDEYNRLLARLAAAHPAQVSVVPFGAMLSPAGTFQLDVGGVQVRTPDGVHTPAYVPGNVFAGTTTSPVVADRFYAWIGPRLWPDLVSPPATPVTASAATRTGSPAAG